MWQEIIAERVVEEVTSANFGRWPETRQEWERIAGRFGMEVCYQAGLPPEHAGLIEDVLHIPTPGSGRLAICDPVYTHELAESALLWEGTEPYAVPTQPSLRSLRHAVASIVERLIREFDPAASCYLIAGEEIPCPTDADAPPVSPEATQPQEYIPDTLSGALQILNAAREQKAKLEAEARAWAETEARIRREWGIA